LRKRFAPSGLIERGAGGGQGPAVAAIEARLGIGQPPIRYAIAVDARDVDSWVQLFVPDVNMGRHGQGREALRGFIEPQLRTFHRSAR